MTDQKVSGKEAVYIKRSAFGQEISAVIEEAPLYGQWIEIWGIHNGQKTCVRRLMGLPYGTTTVTWHDFEVKKSDTNITEKF